MPGATQAGVAQELGITSSQLKVGDLSWRRRARPRPSNARRSRRRSWPSCAARKPPEGRSGGDAEGFGFFRAVGDEHMNAKLVFIAAHASEHAVRRMCRILLVSPSWFHAWRAAAPERAARQAAWDETVAPIRAIFAESRARYGAPRIRAELVAQGERIARKRVAKLMKSGAPVARSTAGGGDTADAGSCRATGRDGAGRHRRRQVPFVEDAVPRGGPGAVLLRLGTLAAFFGARPEDAGPAGGTSWRRRFSASPLTGRGAMQ